VCLRELTVLVGQACGMLAVVDDAQVRAGDRRAAWSESFNEMFAQVAGVFGNAAVRRHGRACLLGLLSHMERKNSWSLAELAGGRVAGRDAAAAQLLAVGPGRMPGRNDPVRGEQPGGSGGGTGGG
jgi:hypothetical protein